MPCVDQRGWRSAASTHLVRAGDDRGEAREVTTRDLESARLGCASQHRRARAVARGPRAKTWSKCCGRQRASVARALTASVRSISAIWTTCEEDVEASSSVRSTSAGDAESDADAGWDGRDMLDRDEVTADKDEEERSADEGCQAVLCHRAGRQRIKREGSGQGSKLAKCPARGHEACSPRKFPAKHHEVDCLRSSRSEETPTEQRQA